MVVKGVIKKGAYFDSVALMNVGRELSARDGVVDAAVVMGTKENKGILANSSLLLNEFKNAADTDLLIGIKAKTQAAAESAVKAAEELLAATRKQASGGSEDFKPMSLAGALEKIPDANLALISVAGRYAAGEAMKALAGGLHVMLFSDNVSIEDEKELKQFARKKGLLVMGPDCGTAIINGVPLAFANVVNRGDIGVVAASGTGCQEVTSIISNEGCGISQAIGTGGRDVKKDIGGIMFIESLKALVADKSTKVILLVSKPPHESVMREIRKITSKIRKPVVSMFLGAAPTDPLMALTLDEAALKAVALARGRKVKDVERQLAESDAALRDQAKVLSKRCKKGQKYLRGLFSGGTFCTEAQILYQKLPGGLYANAPAGSAKRLKNLQKSQKNTVIDLGEDEFTVGRPHPMIDFSLRNRRIAQEASDPETAVILLDVVLGYGSNMDPAVELKNVVAKAAKKVQVICSVTGTDQDPQNRRKVQQVLQQAGAVVMPTNAAACRLAGYIIENLGA